ncbi:hypothetical protein AB0F96_26710 [Streptomyces sp. NPDC023998]|uniref:hypothetical protein n=1 Tax=Streptomyces sp. NPDC023998 TaxID=3154597 RepID=UPI0033D2A5F8
MRQQQTGPSQSNCSAQLTASGAEQVQRDRTTVVPVVTQAAPARPEDYDAATRAALEHIADRKRASLLLRAVIADLVALAGPSDFHTAAQAAAAANALRRADWKMCLPAEAARAWLREQYLEHQEAEDPHPPNCPGGCRGSGTVIEPVIWQSDGVPLHAEPVGCLRGEEADPHAADCTGCHGTGRKYDAEHREYQVCGYYTPDPAYESAPRPAACGDPWSSSPQCGYDDEPPF